MKDIASPSRIIAGHALRNPTRRFTWWSLQRAAPRHRRRIVMAPVRNTGPRCGPRPRGAPRLDRLAALAKAAPDGYCCYQLHAHRSTRDYAKLRRHHQGLPSLAALEPPTCVVNAHSPYRR